MTREYAKSIINRLYGILSEEYKTALDVLTQEPCSDVPKQNDEYLNEHELCNNCISKGGCPHKAPMERILSCYEYKPIKGVSHK